MRPASRGSTSLARPMTGLGAAGFGRPPTGGARLSTARLRTGTNPTGAGMQAAQGFALNMNISVQDRPMTGLGGLRLKTGTGRIVEDSAYHVGILRKKVDDITQETRRLQKVLDSNIKESTTLANLEKKFENLMKSKESQEGQLADINLALDKTRTSTDPESVSSLASEISEKNKQTRIELDRIFALRKDREVELGRVEEQTNQAFHDVETRVRELDPSKQRIYKELSHKQTEFHVSISDAEVQLQEVNGRIERLEEESRNNPHRKEYLTLERQYQQLRRELAGLDGEMEIMQLPAKEAQAKYVARVNEFKQGAKECEDKAAQLRDYVAKLKTKSADLDKQLQDQKKVISKILLYLFTKLNLIQFNIST